MKTPLLSILAAFLLTGAMRPGSDNPLTTVQPAVGVDAAVATPETAVRRVDAGATNRLPHSPSADPLGVWIFCTPYFSNIWECSAYASGGSGTGYTFSWFPQSSYEFTNENFSSALVSCTPGGMSGLEAYVTDSNGAYAWSTQYVYCSY